MKQANTDIRLAIKNANLRFWQVADVLGLSDGAFSRRLRHEFSQAQKAEVYKAIQTLSSFDGGGDRA